MLNGPDANAPCAEAAPSPAAVEAVVFDLGNVLIAWDPRHLYRKIFVGDEAGMERFLRDVCTSTWNESHDAGRSFAESIPELIAAHPHHAASIRAYRERWSEMLPGALTDTVRVLEDLKARGLPVFALSNWSQETFPEARARFDFLGLFDSIVLSGEERLIKPDPRIYQVLLARFRLVPSRTVFIDDLPRNVEAARRLGLIGLHFQGADGLRRDLQALGCLSPAPVAP